jgi:hypothetical protein
MNYIKSLVIILSFVVSFPVQASSYEEQIVNVVKNIQGILVIDKTKSEYQNYSDKKQELEIQLNRFDGIAPENLVEAREISHDYGELRRSISSSIVKD